MSSAEVVGTQARTVTGCTTGTRFPGNWLDFNVGFRCVRDLQGNKDPGTPDM